MILEALKTKTATSHHHVETSLLMQPISTRQLTPENYTQILRRFYGFFQPLETAIAQLTGLENYLPDLADRRKARTLLTDIKEVTQLSVSGKELPICTDLPPVTNISEGLGALYVMEGSTLGGKFISKAIHETLGFTPEKGTAFFSGYGSRTGTMWKTFQAALLHYAATTCQETAVITSADTTFRKLGKWFNQ